MSVKINLIGRHFDRLKVIKELPMDIDGEAGTPASDGSVKAPVDGTYTIYSKKSGINIYKINVGK